MIAPVQAGGVGIKERSRGSSIPPVPLAEVNEPSGEIAETADQLSCTVFRDFAGLDELRTAWDDAVLRAGGSIYMTFDWVRTWWQFYGEGAELRLFVFRAGDRIVAILPIYIDALGSGPLRFRVARLVGASIPPKVFDPPIPRACVPAVLTEAANQLFVRDGCDVMSLGPVSELQGWRESVEGLRSASPRLIGECVAVKGLHSVFHLPSEMEAYYSSLSKNERKNRRKYELRLLKKEYDDARAEVVSDPALISAEFEAFAEQHRKQWLSEGRTGHFGAWPRALEFNRALVRAQAQLGRLRFIRIVADGKVVANQYTFAFGDRYYWELPSRVVDPAWDRFSLGPTGIVTMLGQAIAEGMKDVEGGLAHYDYKIRLGAKEYAAPTFRIVASRPASRARLAVFSLAHTFVSLAYQKVWYRRIMPRLPVAFWRPQWRLWLRLDF